MFFWPKKIFVTPAQGGFRPKKPFLTEKMAFCAYIFETAHQILMIFSQMLDIIIIIIILLSLLLLLLLLSYYII